MLLRLRVSILLRHSKVYYVYYILRFRVRSANKEVVRFDIAVYKVLLVYCLDAREHLLGHHDYRFYREAAATVIEEVF